MSDVVKKFLVLEKEYADECQHLDFRTFIKQATAVSSSNPRFDHEDAAEHMAESLATDGDLQEGTRWYLVIEEGQTRVADAKVVSVNSSLAGWTHFCEDHGQYERPRRRA